MFEVEDLLARPWINFGGSRFPDRYLLDKSSLFRLLFGGSIFQCLFHSAFTYHCCSYRFRSQIAKEFIARRTMSIMITPAAARTRNSSCGLAA